MAHVTVDSMFFIQSEGLTVLNHKTHDCFKIIPFREYFVAVPGMQGRNAATQSFPGKELEGMKIPVNFVIHI